MKISLKEKVSYGIGAVGKDMVYMLVNSFILIYYNTVLGINSAYVGAVLMAARIFDAFNDPFMGIVVAKTKSRWGKFRPWIFSGTVLNALVLYALFAVPESMSKSSIHVYLMVIYLIWGVTYTLMDIPYWSMIPAITEAGRDREGLSSLARSCAGFGSAFSSVLTLKAVALLGGGSMLIHQREGYKYWALIVAVLFVISEAVCCKNIKEKEMVNVKAHKIGDMFRALFANDQAVVTVVTIILVNTSLYVTSSLIIYYFTYVIGNGESGYGIFSAFGGAAQILAMMFFPMFRKRMEKKQLFIHSIIYELIGYVSLILITFSGIVTKFWMILFVPGFLIFMGSGLLNVLITVFLSDSVDYGEVQNGSRDESVIFSMQTFVVKLASGFAVAMAGAGIQLIGLDVNAGVNQAKSVVTGLNLIMTLIPIAGLVAAWIYFGRKYHLDEKKMKEITDTLNKKRNEV